MAQPRDEAAAAAAELEALLMQSEAPRALDSLERGGAGAGAPPPDRLATARGAYSQLQHAALRAVADLAALQRRVAGLLVQAQGARVHAEMEAAAASGDTDPIQVIDRFREDRDCARRQAMEAADGEEAARQQVEALFHRLSSLTAKLTEAEDERRAELEPEIKAAKDDVALLQSQLEGERAKADAAQREAADIGAKLETLQMEIANLQTAVDEERDAAQKAEVQPGRIRHLADLVVSALRQLREEEVEATAQLRVQEAAEEGFLQESKELMVQHTAAVKANDKLRLACAVRERAADEVARDIEMARVEAERLLAEQVTWDVEVEKKKADAKREAEGVKSEQRAREVAQRKLNRAELEAAQLADQLPELRTAVANARGALGAEQRAATKAAEAGKALQAEMVALVETVAQEKQLTDVQTQLVRAGLSDVRHLDEESAALKAAAAERDAAIRAATSQHDAAVRFLNQRLQRLAEVIDEAEAKDGEVDELHKKKREVKSAHADLRDLCSLMSGQMGRFRTLLEYARRGAQDLGDKVAAAEEELTQLKVKADTRGTEARRAERERASAQADKALLAGKLSAARRGAAGVAEVADDIAIEHALVARAAEEAEESVEALAARKASALAAKQAAQAALLERSEEMMTLYDRSAALQEEMDEGTLALQRCDDDMRLLQLEVGELQRRVFATHKTAPDVVSYDRQIATLKADVLRARKEADSLGATVESPAASKDRWRVLPGKLPGREDLAGRIAVIEERLGARADLVAQKDQVLEELEALTEGLVEKARASHHPAFDLSVRMNEARRQQQQLTRRMMATVSELSLYQALSLKCAADKEGLAAELAAAKHNVAVGRPPTAGADQEFERQERDRAAEAEVRAQAAELRALKEEGLLGVLRSAASPRPQAYIPEELGVPVPFPAAFKPFKPSEPPAAVALAAQKAAAVAAAEAAAEQRQQREQQQRQGGGSASRAGQSTPAPQAMLAAHGTSPLAGTPLRASPLPPAQAALEAA